MPDDRRRDDRKSSKLSSNVRDRSPLSKGRKNAPDKRVFVSNIPYEYRWQDLKDLFRDQVGEVAYVELFKDEKDKSKGCGIVEFEDQEKAQLAVEKMHRFELKGRKLVVREDTKEERDMPASNKISEFGNRSSNNGSQSRNHFSEPSQSSYNTFGLSPSFLESLNINGPLVNKIFVSNLDYKVDEKKLKDVFKLAGRVATVDLAIDKDGKSRGFGTVEYEHPVEAVQAISMLHNQYLYERRINVRMDKVNENSDGPFKLPDGLKGVGMGLGANGAPLKDVTKNLPSTTSPKVPPVAPNFPSAASSALAALVERVGSRGGSLLGENFAANLAGLNASSLSNSFAGVNSSSGVSDRPFLSGSSSLGLGSGSLGGRLPGSLSAALSLAVSKNDNNVDYMSSVRLRPPERNSDAIIIKNLPSNTTWKMLRDKFCEAGDIKFAEMKSRDTGMIRFSSENDAKRAISMFDNYRLDGKPLSVDFY